MDLRQQLLQEHSKENTRHIIRWIGASQQRLDQLVQLLLKDSDYKVIQRAAWPLSYVAQEQPGLIKKHLPALIKNLEQEKLHDAVKRNTLRLLQYLHIPARQKGMLMDRCFRYITSPAEKAAIKAFSLSILENMLDDYPEIGRELYVIINEQWSRETPAFRSRAKKVLKKIQR
ncbi:MAG TPA: hypothetical protein PKC69_10075 [Chitinophagaceae bacterium]|nr:hypothetical protein [Chitinophagaceae bacterium]